MSLRAVCPSCQASFDLANGYQGKRALCARCRQPFWVAGTAAPAGEDVVEAEVFDEVITAALADPESGRGPRQRTEGGAAGFDKRRQPARRRRTSGRAGPRAWALLVAGGAVALLLLAGLAGLAAYLAGRPSSVPSAVRGAVPSPQPPAGTALPAQVLQEVKDATVFVKVAAGEMTGSGSGFVVKTQGATGYVVTNHHVITPPPDDDLPGAWRGFRGPGFPGRPPFAAPARPTLTLVFRSGTRLERGLPATVVLDDAARDLAVLQVTAGAGLPQPIALVRNPDLAETMPVFLFGFPFGDALGLDNANPAVTVGKGSVSSIRLNPRGDLARIQIDGDLNPGNSGGPVVDARGRLVGIAVAKVRNTQIGLAIPPGDLISLLEAAARR